MTKIRTQNVLLTLAAFAALFFLLPADKDMPGMQNSSAQFNSSNSGLNQKTLQQQPVRGNFLRSL